MGTARLVQPRRLMEDVSSKWKVKIYWLNLSAYCQPTCTAVTDRTICLNFSTIIIFIYMCVCGVNTGQTFDLARWSWSSDRVYIINDKKIEEAVGARSSIYVTTYVQRYSIKIQAICQVSTHKLYIISDRSDQRLPSTLLVTN